MISKLIISSMQAMIQMLEQHPELYQIAAFGGVRSAVDQAKKYRPAGCRTCGGQLAPMNPHSAAFEGALVSLRSEDVAKIKSVLKIGQFCYYVRDAETHKLKLKCL